MAGYPYLCVSVGVGIGISISSKQARAQGAPNRGWDGRGSGFGRGWNTAPGLGVWGEKTMVKPSTMGSTGLPKMAGMLPKSLLATPISVGGATKTGASAVAFSVNPDRTKPINPPQHTRATDSHWQPMVRNARKPQTELVRGIARIKPSSTSRSFLHRWWSTLVVASAPCIAPGWPWPTAAALTLTALWLPLPHGLATSGETQDPDNFWDFQSALSLL